jgi:superfamily II RNA helicase
MVSILYGYLCPSFPCNLICSIALICSLCQGTFNDLDHHQVASLASCFVPCDKSSEQIRLRNELSRPMMQLQEAARKIAEVYTCLISILIFH